MDSNLLIYILSSAAIAMVIGVVIGYLLGVRGSAVADSARAAAEAKASEVERQLRDRSAEMIRVNESADRRQEKLIEAESARTRAETELIDARQEIAEKRGQLGLREAENTELSRTITALKESNSEIKARNYSLEEQLAQQKQFLSDANEKLREAFESLSSEALRRNSTSFLEAARETLDSRVKESEGELERRKQAIESLVKPLGESLNKFETQLGEIEKARAGAYEGLRVEIANMQSTTANLSTGTNQLVSALKTSHTRGRYGEISLRRVMEAAGMSPYCDFVEQESVRTDSGLLRPDVVVNIPGNRKLIIDAKTPYIAYQSAFETDDQDERIVRMRSHASAVRDHLKKLSHAGYWQQFDGTIDFVVLYMHIESSFGAALEHDPTLIEDAIKQQIVFATPTTLITMMRTVGFMWQQERVAQSIYEMRDAGVELYKRTNTMLGHLSRVGTGLTTAVDNYNKAVGSIESRVIPGLEKLKEIGGTLAKDDVNRPRAIETLARQVSKQLPGVEDDDSELH